MLSSREVHLAAVPDGVPKPHDFAIVERVVPPPAAGRFLIRNRVLSVDPYMRPRLSNGRMKVGAVMTGGAVGEVIASRHPDFPEGAIVLSQLGFREIADSDGEAVERLDVRGEPLGTHLGVLGMTGLTAYAGLTEIAPCKAGDHVFVSAAAGAVGSVAAQIAKIRGARVVGSAGSAAKCAWLREVAGLDGAINYREGLLRHALKEAMPDGIDVYFDNVGGEHLDAVLPRMRTWGRIALCGMISTYNNKGALSTGVTTLSSMLYSRVTMRAFIVGDHAHLKPRFQDEMRQWLAEGRMHYAETVLDGIESAPAALIGLFAGDNLGKMLVRLDEGAKA
ncbi:MAG TPA: NADP-dependent oxidoreductase [Nevskiaceae bacterium]|nr:NADP-dependent oxidoreductase [Nevskiaceae bacterium]